MENERGWSALVVDDDPGVRQSIRLCLEADGARVLGVATGGGALEAIERSRFDVVFLDLWLNSESGLDVLPEILRRQADAAVIVITAFATFETAVSAMKKGAADYLPKPFTPEQVRHAARRILEARKLRRKVTELEERAKENELDAVFETESPAYRAFLATVDRAAASDVVLLLRGESGTGKNVLARRIRDLSARNDAPFVSVNCPTLSKELMSSTLFGHRKGAFTGAVADAAGKVQEAEGGTLFLDEIGDLDLDAQARLLRFLNDRSYEMVGDAKERIADVRLIAATNRALEKDVDSGRFREDLLYRLKVLPLTIPPLRERVEDVMNLARYYLNAVMVRQGRSGLAFSHDAEQALIKYSWPGNLRELKNAVERAAILAPTSTVEAIDLGIPAPGGDSRGVRGDAVHVGDAVSLEAIEREHIARIVAKSETLEAAARTLEIDATTLQRKRKRYGLG